MAALNKQTIKDDLNKSAAVIAAMQDDRQPACIEIPSANASTTREGHIVTGQIACGLIESSIFEHRP